MLQKFRARYQYDERKPITKPYDDQDIHNSYYKAYDSINKKNVLISVYSSTKADQIGAYDRKIKKIKKLNHPNLVQIYDIFADQQTHKLYLVLEWTKGESIVQYAAKDAQIDYKLASKIIYDICAALLELHQANICHSFVNLENIQLGEQGQAKLSVKCLIYKTFYLSPEVKENHHKTKESDIFSLGVCFYRLLFGGLPFREKTNEGYRISVTAGPKLQRQNSTCTFPIVLPNEVKEVLNTMLHIDPAYRLRCLDMIKSFQAQGRMQSSLPPAIFEQALKDTYIPLRLCSDSNLEQTFTVVSPKNKKIYSLNIVKSKLSEISSYIDCTLKVFFESQHPRMLRVLDYYALEKSYLVIVAEYNNQYSLKEYRGLIDRFPPQVTDTTFMSLVDVLSVCRQQYKFLTNEEVLLDSGELLIKYPPFPTPEFYARLKQAKRGGSFIAPEIALGSQSKTADSWSLGVIQYWMLFNKMPQFEGPNNSKLAIPPKHSLAQQKVTELCELVQKKHIERRNLFLHREEKGDELPPAIGVSGRNASTIQAESPTRSKKVEVKNANKQSTMQLNYNTQDIQDFQDDSSIPDRKSSGVMMSPRKDNGDTVDIRNRINSFQAQDSLQINKYRTLTISANKEDFKGPISPVSLTRRAKAMARFRDTPTAENQILRDTLRASEVGLKTEDSANVGLNLHKVEMAVEPQSNASPPFNLGQLATRRATKLAKLEGHWSKPIRVTIKIFLALVFYIFLYYYNFFATNGSLLSSRYAYNTLIVPIRGLPTDSTPSINFTMVTRTPTEAMALFKNQTLTLVRDQYACVVNNYGYNSSAPANVLETLNTAGFAAYQAFGFLFTITNLVLLIVVLAKLDFPKACSLAKFEDNIVSSLFAWLFVNLGLASSNSFIYLVYGGLFNLDLDPCLARPRTNNLMYIFKNQSNLFFLRCIWGYIGLALAYSIIIFFLCRPKARLSKWWYIGLLVLYLIGCGVRGLGTFIGTKESVFGVLGQLLHLLLGIMFLVIDFVVGCKMKTVSSELTKQEMESLEDINHTNVNLKEQE